jgi:starch synthase (maltosyl-transferring)
MIGLLNHARREQPALQELSNVTFLETDNDELIAYAKVSEGSTVFVVVNIDPAAAQEGVAEVPPELGLPAAFTVRDLLSGDEYEWHTARNYVRLVPGQRQAHVLAVVPGR